MNYKKNIEKILTKVPKNTLAYTVAKDLENFEGNEYSNEEFLENLNDLMYWLYVLDKKDYCISFHPIFEEIKITSNKNIWTWVESSLLLLSSIYKDLGDVNKSEWCLLKVKEALNIGSELVIKLNAKAKDRNLEGVGLYYNEIQEAMEENDKEAEMTYRLIQIKRLCYIKELGGSASFSKLKAEKEMYENIIKLRSLLLHN